MDIDESAPIKASGSIDIAAPADDVWAVMTEFHRWQCWNPEIREAKLEGALEPGATFRWRSVAKRWSWEARSRAMTAPGAKRCSRAIA